MLELAIGTGRVALPLAARVLAVEGVDASEAMVDRLRAKAGGESIPVIIGDMAEIPVSGPFDLVYLVYNTLFALLTPDRPVCDSPNGTPTGTGVLTIRVDDRRRHAALAGRASSSRLDRAP